MEAVREATPAPSAEVDPKAFEESHKKHLSEREVSDYGEDTLKLQARVARGVAEAVVSARVNAVFSDLSSRIAQLEGRLLNQAGMSFWQQVNARYPNAKQINDSDPDWETFLDGVEPVSGVTFREIGEKAVRAGDVDRCVKLFEMWKPGAGAPEGAERPTPVVKPRRASGNGAPVAPKPALRIRESEMTQFYSDVARGKYRGREDEMKAKERAIEDALARGAMVPG
jgi:hypothetical protein